MLKDTKKNVKKVGKSVVTGYRTFSSEQARKAFVQRSTDYNEKKYKSFSVRLNYGEDDEIIKWLESQDNVNAYLKQLLLNDAEQEEVGK